MVTLEKAKARGRGLERSEDDPISKEQFGAMSDALETLHGTVDTMADDVRATIEAFKKELVEMNAKLNTTMRKATCDGLQEGKSSGTSSCGGETN